MEHLDEIEVQIHQDPFEMLQSEENGILQTSELKPIKGLCETKNQNRRLALKLYKEKKGICKVEEKSGLNIWNAGGRRRHPDEVYIPFNRVDRERKENEGFFPPRDIPFRLILPDNTTLDAKVCQDNGKAIMSNPNCALGKWLLRDVLEVPEGTLITYELLQEKGFDTVVFEKIDELEYKIDFTDSSVYDKLYKLKMQEK